MGLVKFPFDFSFNLFIQRCNLEFKSLDYNELGGKKSTYNISYLNKIYNYNLIQIKKG